MFKLKVGTIKKEHSIPDNKDYLKVSVSVMLGDEVVEVRHLGFDLDLDKEGLSKELQKFIDNYNSEKEMANANAEADAKDAEIVAMSEELEGLEFSKEESQE